jgi:hypothetical protein
MRRVRSGSIFLWTIVHTDSSIGDIGLSVVWDIALENERDGVRSGFAVGDALCEPAQFVGKGSCPDPFVFVAFNEIAIFHGGSCVAVNDGVGPASEGAFLWVME